MKPVKLKNEFSSSDFSYHLTWTLTNTAYWPIRNLLQFVYVRCFTLTTAP